MKRNLIIILIACQLALAFNFVLLPPKKAQACQVFGSGADCTIADIPRMVEKFVIGLLVRIGQNYANKYLTQFVQKLQDKYRIKDFLFYEQYLTDYYLSNLILKNVKDPNLKKAADIFFKLQVNGDPRPGTPSINLVGLLKQEMGSLYELRGGIPDQSIYTPPIAMSDDDYFSSLQLRGLNPPSLTERDFRAQMAQYESEAAAASKQENATGNGLKAGRTIAGECSNRQMQGGADTDGDGEPDGLVTVKDPVACAKTGGTWDPKKGTLGTALGIVGEVRSFISNPTAYTDKWMNAAVHQITGNNFNSSDPYTQIGMAIGDFIFTTIDLKTTSGTFNETPGNDYDPSGQIEPPKTIDIDNDGIPDGEDRDKDNKLESRDIDYCYHGGKVPTCKKSSEVTGSNYFYPICQNAEEAIDQLQKSLQFYEDHKDQNADDTDFVNESDALVWGQISNRALTRVDNLLNLLKEKVQPDGSFVYEQPVFNINKYTYYLDKVVNSFFSDADINLRMGPGVGDGGTFFRLRVRTMNITKYLQDFRESIQKCDKPDDSADAANNLPDPGDIGWEDGDPEEDFPTCTDDPTAIACTQPNRADLVERVKNYLITKGVIFNTHCASYEIVRRVAWVLRDQGAGLLATFHTSQCNGFSSDLIAFPDGSVVDILQSAGPPANLNGPQWLAFPPNPNPEDGVFYVPLGPSDDPEDPPGSY